MSDHNFGTETLEQTSGFDRCLGEMHKLRSKPALGALLEATSANRYDPSCAGACAKGDARDLNDSTPGVCIGDQHN